MSDAIERIKKRIEDVQSKLDRSVFCDYDNAKYDGYECALIIIDEELAKEPQECKWTKGINSVETCWGDIDIKIFNQFKRQGAKFCPYCGRRIKVIE